MKVIISIRNGLYNILPPFLCILLSGYFIWHAIHGEHGIKAYQKQLKVYEKAQQAFYDAHKEQDIWHRRVRELGEQALDKDLLDERSHTMLNSARSGDIIIPYNENEHLY